MAIRGIGLGKQHRGQGLTVRIADPARFKGNLFNQLFKGIYAQWTTLRETTLKGHREIGEVDRALIKLGEQGQAQAHDPRKLMFTAMDLFILIDTITNELKPLEKRSEIRRNILSPIGEYLIKKHNAGVIRPAVNSEFDPRTQNSGGIERETDNRSGKMLVHKVVAVGLKDITSGVTISAAVVILK